MTQKLISSSSALKLIKHALCVYVAHIVLISCVFPRGVFCHCVKKGKLFLIALHISIIHPSVQNLMEVLDKIMGI